MYRNKLDQTFGSSSEIYDGYVQLLFKYGMNICEDRALVLETITQLFVHVRRQGKILVTGATLRFCLFKRFRDLIYTYATFEPSPSTGSNITDRPLVETIEQTDTELSRSQREAVFLKLYCEFSYEQVASIMHLDAESTYELITRAFQILRQQHKNEGSKNAVYAIQLH